MPHLVVSISGHGFGHVAQTAPILNALHRLMPALQMTVRSAVPLAHLRSRINAPFGHLQSEGDIGMVMSSALDVRAEASRAAYQIFHANWSTRVDAEATLLRELKADFVFSNVGYLPLAGAQRAGIANAALCSLNWFDIYQHYCASTGSARTGVEAQSDDVSRTTDEKILAQIYSCYANADAFLRATPGMAMESLPNLIPVSPIADIGNNRRDELNRKLNLAHDEKLVLVSMGGIATRLALENWPRIDGVRYLVQASWQAKHPDAIVLESLPMGFSDLLASCDALLCKPGYGSFVEATCSGIPVLYVNRADWPESSVLVEWLQQHGVCREVSRADLDNGNIARTLSDLWTASPRAPTLAQGGNQVAEWLAQRIS
jgi:hypothetical protein